MITVEIGNKTYKVKEAKTEEERRKGLLNVEELPQDEGMLFYFEEPQEVSMWMKDTKIPLDIVFIDEDEEVISVKQGKPNDETLLTEQDVKYVLEVNVNSGIRPGDELDFEDDTEDEFVMKVLAPDGSTLYQLKGGERIVSRRETVILIKKAKKAEELKNTDPLRYIRECKALGKYMFKVLQGLNDRKPEYVETPK